MMLFSIVTVTYNAEHEIEETIQSVINQSFRNFEYIIQDGCSKDKTISIATKYKIDFQNKGINFKIVQKKDTGIYNAMNNSVSHADGNYILFLNAGDRFCHKDVLLKVYNSIKSMDFDIVYGDTILSRNGMFKYEEARTKDSLAEGIPFGHQSVFTRKSLLYERQYDEHYKICADYEFYAYYIKNNAKCLKLDIPISVYQLGGMSSSGGLKYFYEEKLSIALKYNLMSKSDYLIKLEKAKINSRRLCLIEFIKKFVPQFIIKNRQKRILIKEGWIDNYESIANKHGFA